MLCPYANRSFLSSQRNGRVDQLGSVAVRNAKLSSQALEVLAVELFAQQCDLFLAELEVLRQQRRSYVMLARRVLTHMSFVEMARVHAEHGVAMMQSMWRWPTVVRQQESYAMG